MSIIYQNGLGDTLGDSLATARPLYSTGNVWYVLNGGTDAASPGGQNREKPLATIAQAITNAADNDIIELLSGHTETLVGSQAITKKLTIVGGGLSGALPTVKIGFNIGGATTGFNISGTNVEFRNIWFLAAAQLSTGYRIATSAALFKMRGCYVECGANDNQAALFVSTGADQSRLENTTFISTAPTVASQPATALLTGAIADFEMDGVTFSAGTVGFSNYRAWDGSVSAITRLKARNVNLLLGADVKLNAATTGYLATGTVTGGSRIDW